MSDGAALVDWYLFAWGGPRCPLPDYLADAGIRLAAHWPATLRRLYVLQNGRRIADVMRKLRRTP